MGKVSELRRSLVIEGETIDGHARRIACLRESLDHTIDLLSLPMEGTCVTHAFGLMERHRQLVAELEALDVRPGLAFINWLLDQRLLTEVQEPMRGNLVLYFSHGNWRHAGILGNNARLVSQWGNYGVYEHGLAEVPINYGDTTRFFAMPPAEDVAELLFAFASTELGLNATEAERLRVIVGMPNQVC